MNIIDLNKEFHMAIWGGRGTNYAKLAELVEAGADVNSRGHREVPLSDHKTALAQAIHMENYGLFVFLLDLGADVNFLTRQSGSLPLHYAVSCHKNPAVFVGTLLAHGADPHLETLPYNESAYQMAHRMGREKAVQIISEMCPLHPLHPLHS
jgi:ankyrin repeat protein